MITFLQTTVTRMTLLTLEIELGPVMLKKIDTCSTTLDHVHCIVIVH